LGDLINKGPSSAEVVQFVYDLKVEVLLGNHEMGLLKAIQTSLLRPQHEKLLSELGAKKGPIISWIKSFPLYIEDKDFLAVHAGVPPNQPLNKTPASILTQIRTWDGQGMDLNNEKDPPWFEFYQGTKPIVFGHWAKRGLIVRPNAYGLDTGCVYGKKLTALILPHFELVHVKAKKVYKDID